MGAAARLSGVWPLLAMLIAAPVGMLVLHSGLHRLLIRNGTRLSGHASGVRAIALGFPVVVALATGIGALSWDSNALVDLISGLAYVALVYGAMALLYVNVINVAETSLHMHTLLEIKWAGKLSADTLYAKYNADHMVRERLNRLASLGQLRLVDDRYLLASRWLLWFAKSVEWWRRAINLPTPLLSSEPLPK